MITLVYAVLWIDMIVTNFPQSEYQINISDVSAGVQLINSSNKSQCMSSIIVMYCMG